MAATGSPVAARRGRAVLHRVGREGRRSPPAPFPIIEPGVDRHGDAPEGDRYEHPAEGVEVRHQRQHGPLRLRKHLLRDLDPAAPTVATPAAPPPFRVRLSASTSRAGGVSAAKGVARFGKRSPRLRAGPRSMWMNPERG